MASIDFPNSPTTGTSFSAGGKAWTYNGSVWVLNPRTASKTAYDIAVENGFEGTEEAWLESLVGEDGAKGNYFASESAPSSPGVGDAWFNTGDGRTYIYYDSYWVEVGAAVTGPAGVIAATSPITYNSGTQTVGIDESEIAITVSQISDLTVSATELNYIDGVTASVQTQLNTKTSTGKAIAMAIVFG
jgi:hypothetical protein